MQPKSPYTLIQFPSSRRSTIALGRIARDKHNMRALIEVDVTRGRRLIKEYRRRTGGNLSFFAWFLNCVGQAVAEHPAVHALRKGRDRLVIFTEVDIAITVEKTIGKEKVPLPVVLRRANQKKPGELEQEIRQARAQTVHDENDYVLGDSKYKGLMKLFVSLPLWLQVGVMRRILKDPERVKEMMGTVMVTSVGMMGRAKGWAIPETMHPVCLALGSVVKRPGIDEDGRIAVREYLPVTVLIDHDTVDGAPAARFLSRLTELIESGVGL